MKLGKRLIALLLVLGVMFCLTACKKAEAPTEKQAKETEATTKTEQPEKKILVGFSQMDNNEAWRVTETEDLKAVAEERGYDFAYTDAQSQIAKQLSDIEDLVAQGVDYLVIAPKENTGLERGWEAAKEAGIPVILIDRCHEGVAGEDYATFIASDFVYQGYECGVALAEAMG